MSVTGHFDYVSGNSPVHSCCKVHTNCNAATAAVGFAAAVAVGFAAAVAVGFTATVAVGFVAVWTALHMLVCFLCRLLESECTSTYVCMKPFCALHVSVCIALT